MNHKNESGKEIMLSIIVVNYNHKYFPRMCVEAMEKSKCNFEFEIIAVDNNSHDESVDYLRQCHKDGRLTLVQSRVNLGYGKGNNLGVEYANGKYVMICNPDVFVQEDSFQKMIDYMESHKEIGLLGPKLMYYNGQIQDSCRRHRGFLDLIIKRTPLKLIPALKKRLDKYLMQDFDHNTVQEVELLTGACFVMPTTLYRDIKGFDERYFLFMEDFDLCLRVHDKGFKVVYYPDAICTHYHKRLSQGTFLSQLGKKTFWIHVSSAIKYFWKWRGRKTSS